MIEYHYENDFQLKGHKKYTDWINRVIDYRQAQLGQLSYIFCDDGYLGEINLQYLKHNTFTDIITFDYSTGTDISGDIFISTERVFDNAKKYEVDFENELRRVMVHGVLHLLGHDDKTKEQKATMREQEDELIKMFHVEQ